MAKRRNENNQMRKEEYEYLEEKESEDPGVFQRASDHKIKGRRIVKARKGPSQSSTKSASNPFTAFQGLNTTKTAEKSNPFAAFQGLQAANSAPISNHPSAVDIGNSTPSVGSSFEAEMKVLNREFKSFVDDEMLNHSDELWTSGIKDYMKHVMALAKQYNKPMEALNSLGKKKEVRSTTGMSDGKKLNFDTTPEKAVEARKEDIKPSFSFGSGATNSTTEVKPPSFSFGSNPNSTVEAKPASFSFGSASNNAAESNNSSTSHADSKTPAFSFGGAAAKTENTTPAFSFGSKAPAASNAPATGSNAPSSGFSFSLNNKNTTAAASKETEDDDDNIGKAEPTVVEKGYYNDTDEKATFKADKARLHMLKDKEWVSKGTHSLQVLVDNTTKKSRILMRNSIGQVILNAAIYAGIKVTENKKDGKTTSLTMPLVVDAQPTNFMIRVKPERISLLKSAIDSAAV